MKTSIAISGDQLSNALHVLGVRFIMGGNNQDQSLHERPAELIAALAKSEEARLRLSLIPLFLQHPEFSSLVRSVAESLDPAPKLFLQCYYSAAIWIAKQNKLKILLPDYFSKELNILPTEDPELNLRILAERQRELSGSWTNWLGTYHHAAQVWLMGLKTITG